MKKVQVVSLDEEFEKARTKGAKDIKKRARKSKGNIEGKLPIHRRSRKRISPAVAHRSLYGDE